MTPRGEMIRSDESDGTVDDGSLLGYVTRSTMMGGSVGAATTLRKIESVPESAGKYKDTIVEKFEAEDGATDDDDISLSILESTSSNLTYLRVPTDKEIFAVGWAKALNPSTGSHYYYTLDLSQIL